jgi:hypothetical protein
MNNELNEQELDQKTLKKLLHYDPLTGLFTWKPRTVDMFKPGKHQLNACNSWNTQHAGQEAEKKHKSRNTFYIRIRITLNGKTKRHKAHRLVFLYMEGVFPEHQVDHLKGIGTDNRWSQLSKVTNQENSKNAAIRSDNTSGFTGVTWNKQSNKWEAKIKVNRKTIYGGSFINKADAITRRMEMNLEYGFHKYHGRAKTIQPTIN